MSVIQTGDGWSSLPNAIQNRYDARRNASRRPEGYRYSWYGNAIATLEKELETLGIPVLAILSSRGVKDIRRISGISVNDHIVDKLYGKPGADYQPQDLELEANGVPFLLHGWVKELGRQGDGGTGSAGFLGNMNDRLRREAARMADAGTWEQDSPGPSEIEERRPGRHGLYLEDLEESPLRRLSGALVDFQGQPVAFRIFTQPITRAPPEGFVWARYEGDTLVVYFSSRLIVERLLSAFPSDLADALNAIVFHESRELQLMQTMSPAAAHRRSEQETARQFPAVQQRLERLFDPQCCFASFDEFARKFVMRNRSFLTQEKVARIVRQETRDSLFAVERLMEIRRILDESGRADQPVLIWQNERTGIYFPVMTDQVRHWLGIHEVMPNDLAGGSWPRSARFLLVRTKLRSAEEIHQAEENPVTDVIFRFLKNRETTLVMVDHSSGDMTRAQYTVGEIAKFENIPLIAWTPSATPVQASRFRGTLRGRPRAVVLLNPNHHLGAKSNFDDFREMNAFYPAQQVAIGPKVWSVPAAFRRLFIDLTEERVRRLVAAGPQHEREGRPDLTRTRNGEELGPLQEKKLARLVQLAYAASFGFRGLGFRRVGISDILPDEIFRRLVSDPSLRPYADVVRSQGRIRAGPAWLFRVFDWLGIELFGFNWNGFVVLNPDFEEQLPATVIHEIAAIAGKSHRSAERIAWKILLSIDLPDLPGVISYENLSKTTQLVESVSGIRFTCGENPAVPDEAKAVALAYGYEFGRNVFRRWGTDKQLFRFVLGRDGRFTGKAIKRIQVLGLLMAAQDMGMALDRIELLDIGVATAPMVESAVRTFEADGGIMVTASHNPFEDNGWKFMTGKREPGGDVLNANGGMLSMPKAGRVIENAKILLNDGPRLRGLIARLNGDPAVFEKMLDGTAFARVRYLYERVLDDYLRFIMASFGITERDLPALRKRNQKILMAIDPNGGAACGCAADVLRFFGFRVREINSRRGTAAHRVEPKDEALEDITAFMLRAGADLGGVFDGDADRMVLKYRNGLTEVVDISHQKVAYLNVAGMLAWVMSHRGRFPEAGNSRWGVVINDETSGQIAEFCHILTQRNGSGVGVRVFEAEIGEINVVTRMHELETAGDEQGERYFVPVGVEGPNAGTVLKGGEVRDGVMTMLLSGLLLSHPEVMARLRAACPDQKAARKARTLPDILELLPQNTTYQNNFELQDGREMSQQALAALLKRDFESSLAEDAQAPQKALRLAGGHADEAFPSHSYWIGSRVFKITLRDRQNRSHFIAFALSGTEKGMIRFFVDSPDEGTAGRLLAFQQELFRKATGHDITLKKAEYAPPDLHRREFFRRLARVVVVTVLLAAVLVAMFELGWFAAYFALKKAALASGLLFYAKTAVLDVLTGMVSWLIADGLVQYLFQGRYKFRASQLWIVAIFCGFGQMGTHMLYNGLELLPKAFPWFPQLPGWLRYFLKFNVIIAAGTVITAVNWVVMTAARKISKAPGYRWEREKEKFFDLLLFKVMWAGSKAAAILAAVAPIYRVPAEQLCDVESAPLSAYIVNRHKPLLPSRWYRPLHWIFAHKPAFLAIVFAAGVVYFGLLWGLVQLYVPGAALFGAAGVKYLWQGSLLILAFGLLGMCAASPASIPKQSFEEAYAVVSKYVRKTPLQRLSRFSETTGKTVFLKDDSRQVGGSFKARGVYWVVYRTIMSVVKDPVNGRRILNQGLSIVSQSTGNHGIAMIRAVTHLIKVLSEQYRDDPELVAGIRRIQPVLFAIQDVCNVKWRDIRTALQEYRDTVGDETRGMIVNSFPDYDAAIRAREAFMAEHGETARYITHGGVDIMTGHGSAGIEINEQLTAAGIDESKKVVLVIPAGAGGPIGIGAALKAFRKNVTVVMVQPHRWNAFVRTLRDGVMRKNGDGLAVIPAEDLTVPMEFTSGVATDGPEGEEAVAYARAYVDAAVSVSERHAYDVAAQMLYQDLAESGDDVKVGGTTAITAEALLSFGQGVPALRDADAVVLFATEGNMSPALTDRLKPSPAVDPRHVIELPELPPIPGVVIEQRHYEMKTVRATIQPVIKVAINGNAYLIGNGYYLVITLANGKKIYWAGEHNLSYAFFFEHYRDKVNEMIARGGVVWRHLDAHEDLGEYEYLPRPQTFPVLDWRREIERGVNGLACGNYLGHLALNTMIAKRLQRIRAMQRTGMTIHDLGMSVEEYGLEELAGQDIRGGVFDLDIDLVTDENRDQGFPMSLAAFEREKSHLVSVAERSDVCFLLNSSEHEVAEGGGMGIYLFIDPRLAVRFNAEIIRDLAEKTRGSRSPVVLSDASVPPAMLPFWAWLYGPLSKVYLGWLVALILAPVFEEIGSWLSGWTDNEFVWRHGWVFDIKEGQWRLATPEDRIALFAFRARRNAAYRKFWLFGAVGAHIRHNWKIYRAKKGVFAMARQKDPFREHQERYEHHLADIERRGGRQNINRLVDLLNLARIYLERNQTIKGVRDLDVSWRHVQEALRLIKYHEDRLTFPANREGDKRTAYLLEAGILAKSGKREDRVDAIKILVADPEREPLKLNVNPFYGRTYGEQARNLLADIILSLGLDVEAQLVREGEQDIELPALPDAAPPALPGSPAAGPQPPVAGHEGETVRGETGAGQRNASDPSSSDSGGEAGDALPKFVEQAAALDQGWLEFSAEGLPAVIDGNIPEGLIGRRVLCGKISGNHPARIVWERFAEFDFWIPVTVNISGRGVEKKVSLVFDTGRRVVDADVTRTQERLLELIKEKGAVAVCSKVPAAGHLVVASYRPEGGRRLGKFFLPGKGGALSWASVNAAGLVTELMFAGDPAPLKTQMAVMKGGDGAVQKWIESHLVFPVESLGEIFREEGYFWLAGFEAVKLKGKGARTAAVHIGKWQGEGETPEENDFRRQQFYIPMAYAGRPVELLIGDDGIPVFMAAQGDGTDALPDLRYFLKRLEIRSPSGEMIRVLGSYYVDFRSDALAFALAQAAKKKGNLVITRLKPAYVHNEGGALCFSLGGQQIYFHLALSRYVHSLVRDFMKAKGEKSSALAGEPSLRAEVVYGPQGKNPQQTYAPLEIRLGFYASDDPLKPREVIRFEVLKTFRLRPMAGTRYEAVNDFEGDEKNFDEELGFELWPVERDVLEALPSLTLGERVQRLASLRGMKAADVCRAGKIPATSFSHLVRRDNYEKCGRKNALPRLVQQASRALHVDPILILLGKPLAGALKPLNYGQTVKVLRLRRGWRQEDFARELVNAGLPAANKRTLSAVMQRISGWESGKKSLHREREIIAKVLRHIPQPEAVDPSAGGAGPAPRGENSVEARIEKAMQDLQGIGGRPNPMETALSLRAELAQLKKGCEDGTLKAQLREVWIYCTTVIRNQMRADPDGWRKIERAAVVRVLQEVHEKRLAAERLGISYQALYDRIHDYEISEDELKTEQPSSAGPAIVPVGVPAAGGTVPPAAPVAAAEVLPLPHSQDLDLWQRLIDISSEARNQGGTTTNKLIVVRHEIVQGRLQWPEAQRRLGDLRSNSPLAGAGAQEIIAQLLSEQEIGGDEAVPGSADSQPVIEGRELPGHPVEATAAETREIASVAAGPEPTADNVPATPAALATVGPAPIEPQAPTGPHQFVENHLWQKIIWLAEAVGADKPQDLLLGQVAQELKAQGERTVDNCRELALHLSLNIKISSYALTNTAVIMVLNAVLTPDQKIGFADQVRPFADFDGRFKALVRHAAKEFLKNVKGYVPSRQKTARTAAVAPALPRPKPTPAAPAAPPVPVVIPAASSRPVPAVQPARLEPSPAQAVAEQKKRLDAILAAWRKGESSDEAEQNVKEEQRLRAKIVVGQSDLVQVSMDTGVLVRALYKYATTDLAQFAGEDKGGATAVRDLFKRKGLAAQAGELQSALDNPVQPPPAQKPVARPAAALVPAARPAILPSAPAQPAVPVKKPSPSAPTPASAAPPVPDTSAVEAAQQRFIEALLQNAPAADEEDDSSPSPSPVAPKSASDQLLFSQDPRRRRSAGVSPAADDHPPARKTKGVVSAFADDPRQAVVEQVYSGIENLVETTVNRRMKLLGHRGPEDLRGVLIYAGDTAMDKFLEENYSNPGEDDLMPLLRRHLVRLAGTKGIQAPRVVLFRALGVVSAAIDKALAELISRGEIPSGDLPQDMRYLLKAGAAMKRSEKKPRDEQDDEEGEEAEHPREKEADEDEDELTLPETYAAARWIGGVLTFGAWRPSRRFIQIGFAPFWEIPASLRSNYLKRHTFAEDSEGYDPNRIWRQARRKAGIRWMRWMTFVGLATGFLVAVLFPVGMILKIVVPFAAAALGNALTHMVYNVFNKRAPLTLGRTSKALGRALLTYAGLNTQNDLNPPAPQPVGFPLVPSVDLDRVRFGPPPRAGVLWYLPRPWRELFFLTGVMGWMLAQAAFLFGAGRPALGIYSLPAMRITPWQGRIRLTALPCEFKYTPLQPLGLPPTIYMAPPPSATAWEQLYPYVIWYLRIPWELPGKFLPFPLKLILLPIPSPLPLPVLPPAKSLSFVHAHPDVTVQPKEYPTPRPRAKVTLKVRSRMRENAARSSRADFLEKERLQRQGVFWSGYWQKVFLLDWVFCRLGMVRPAMPGRVEPARLAGGGRSAAHELFIEEGFLDLDDRGTPVRTSEWVPASHQLFTLILGLFLI
ncbi:MAG: pyridoxal-phosphate dependent enzyme [Candidatus Omnitrophota bacterium]|nr:pyridoxal-phosphate dependent enzyme [Candidatus Omnitrophota bacterium]